MLFGGLFALLLAFASINLKADQTIGGLTIHFSNHRKWFRGQDSKTIGSCVIT